MKSNFEFMKEINSNYYEILLKAEKKLYTSKNETGKELRNFWEAFTADIIKNNGIYDKLKKHIGEARINLATCMILLSEPSKNTKKPNGRQRDEEWVNSLRALMKEINAEKLKKSEKPIKLFQDQLFPASFTPKNQTETFSRFYNKSWNTNQNISLTHFFRQYCNDCTHDDKSPEPPYYDVTHYQTIDYLTRLHSFLKIYFGVANLPPYNENLILFDKYEVTKVNSNPSDGFRSGCCKECSANYYATTGFTRELPAIIRFFNKKDLDENFASRSASAYSLIGKNACGKGLRHIYELSGFESDSEFYVVAYVFETNPTVLNNEVLKAASFEARLKWCKEIAAIVENLHTNDPKIFHRLINYSCIYISKERNNATEYVPSLINFSFAKIDDIRAVTVFQNAASAIEKTIERRPEESKYIAPEYARPASVNIDFEKIDIFALGMLISDILCADIAKKPHSAAELKAAGVSDEIIKIIAQCLGVSAVRPTATQVLWVLEKY